MKVSSSIDKKKTEPSERYTLGKHSKLMTQQISERAYHAWLKRGCTHGFDVEDWLEAEKELLTEELFLCDDELEV